VAEPAHILVFYEDSVIGESLLTHLTSEGFKATGAKTPLDAAWCLADGKVHLFLIHFPHAEWVGSALLMEVRSAYPTMPIVALTTTVSNEIGQLLARLQVSAVLVEREGWPGLVRTIREALSASDRQVGEG